MAVFIALVAFFFITTSHLYAASDYDIVPVFFIVPLVLFGVLLGVIMGYISLFLKEFVAALMYKHGLTATEAWRRFLPILGQRPFHFILFGIIWFLLIVAFVICIILAGLMTCCIGFLILIIPYIGTVATLPVLYTYRAFSLEFLAQFGPDYDVFPPKDAAPVAAAK